MRIVLCSVLSTLVVVAASRAADPPVVRPGECLYLVGAPPGAPAATTEVFTSGNRVYGGCTHDPHFDVGRDAPRRLSTWFDEIRPVDARVPSGCRTESWVTNAFSVEAGSGGWVQVTASGVIQGRIDRLFYNDEDNAPYRGAVVLELISDTEGLSEAVLASHEILDLTLPQSPSDVDKPWAAALAAHVPSGGTFSVRLTVDLFAGRVFNAFDFGSPGSGRGVGYDTVSACFTPDVTDASRTADDLERDLHDRRCMPSVWLPAAQGGRLETAQALVASLRDRAALSGDAGVNLGVASDRLERASAEAGRGQYQRACKSLSDAVHALTTP